jgi:3-methyl-2-oxobutanoate hydroxymethyltransferase
MAGTIDRITVPGVKARKASRDEHAAPLAALTAYDFSFARLFDRAGVDIILVGDSLGMVVQGESTTLPVTLDQMVYHTRCVRRGVERALLVADMPFLSYQPSLERAIESAGRLLKEGGASAVKLEGGTALAPAIRRLVELDIPVMAHIGMTPQSIHRMGGFRQQGKSHRGDSRDNAGTWEQIIEDALSVEEAGAFSVVLEAVPESLAREITQQLSIPTIGIAAGGVCDGQILVSYDLLGVTYDLCPPFVKPYAALGEAAIEAVQRFVGDVKSGQSTKKNHERGRKKNRRR